MPQLNEIHEALKKPTLFDKLKERTSTEASQLLDKGKVTYMAKKTFETLPQDVQATLPKPLQEKLSEAAWPAFTSMLEQMDKRAGIVGQTVGRAVGAVKAHPLAATEVGGLGVLAVPGLDTMQAHVRARLAGDKGPNAVEKRQFMGEGGHAVADVAGLGILAHPELKHLLGKTAFANTAYAGNVAQNPPGMRSHSKLAPFVAPELEKKSGALKRIGELATGSKAKALSSAAADHAGAAISKVKNRVTPEGARDAASLVKHLQQTSASAGRERRAAGRIGTLAAKERDKVNETRGIAGAIAVGSTAAALGRKKEAGALSGLGKDPLRQATGVLRTGEKLFGTRAKRLEKHLGGLKQDLSTAKGLRDAVAKDFRKNPAGVDTPKRLESLGSEVGKLEEQRNAAHTALHGKTTRERKTYGNHHSPEDADVYTPGEKAHVAATREQAKSFIPAAGVATGVLVLRHKAIKAREEKKAKKDARLAKKTAGVGVGAGMSTSQYSGPLSLGRFKMVSGAPPFTSPAMDSKKEASSLVDEFHKLLTSELLKSAGGMNTAIGAQHAEGRLHATSSVGAPKMTPPPGPSIAQVAKPKGFGMPLAGAKKGLL